MIQMGKLLELTPFTTGPLNLGANPAHFNLVQTAMQGYTSASEKTNINTKLTGNLTAVAVTPAAGNREIDHELVLRAQRGDKRAFGMLVEKYQRKLGRLLSLESKIIAATI